MENYAIEAAPLYDLLKKNTKFAWSTFYDAQFKNIKYLIQNAKMLTHPNFEEPFIVCVDASNTGIGFYLAQVVNNELVYITFGGRSLSDTERRYAILDKELLAILYAVKTCYVYLCRHYYIVYSDHKPLN